MLKKFLARLFGWREVSAMELTKNTEFKMQPFSRTTYKLLGELQPYRREYDNASTVTADCEFTSQEVEDKPAAERIIRGGESGICFKPSSTVWIVRR